MITCAHIADIHIGSNAGRSSEYRQVFDKFHADIIAQQVNLVIICGDVFHNKNKYSGEDVADFKYLLKGIPATINIILIPGNHDTNLNDSLATNLIEPILEPELSPHIIWMKNSGSVTLRGQTFVHISVTDESTIEDLYVQYPEDHYDSILLYHGFVSGAVFGKHVVRDKDSNNRITNKFADKFRAVFCGDIHGMQMFGPKLLRAYSGSMIQQNVSEDTNKGYLLWQIPPNPQPMAPPTFRQLHNSTGMIKLDLRGKTTEEIEQIINSTQRPEILLRVTLHTDSADSTEQQRMIMEKFGRIDKVDYKDNVRAHDMGDIEETLTQLLLDQGIDLDNANEIITDYKSRTAVNTTRWTVKTMEWDNMFVYGPGNRIDFQTLPGISGVVANNRAGKSSIIDILVWALFNDVLRGNKEEILNKTLNKTARVYVEFTVGSDNYSIERFLDTNDKDKYTLKKNNTNITPTGITPLYKIMRQLIGTPEQFLATGVYYDDTYNIINMKNTQRTAMMTEILGIDDSSILEDTKKKISALKKTLATIPKGPENAQQLYDAATAALAVATTDANKAQANVTTAQHLSTFQTTDKTTAASMITELQMTIDTINKTLDAIPPVDNPPATATEVILTPSYRKELELAADFPIGRPVDIPQPTIQGRYFTSEQLAALYTTAAIPPIVLQPSSPPAPRDTTELTGSIAVVTSNIKKLQIDQFTQQEIIRTMPVPTNLTVPTDLQPDQTPVLEKSLQITTNHILELTKSLEELPPAPLIPQLTDRAEEYLAECKKQLAAVNIQEYKNKSTEATEQYNIATAAYTESMVQYNTTVTALNNAVVTAKARSEYKFAPNCSQCTQNCKLLAAGLAQAEKDLADHITTAPIKPDERLHANMIAATSALEEAVIKERKLEQLIAKLEKHITEHITAKSAVQRHQTDVSRIQNRIQELSATAQQLKQQINDEHVRNINLNYNNALKQLTDINTKLSIEQDKLSTLQADLVSLTSETAAYNQYHADKLHNDSIVKATADLKEHEAYLEYKQQMDKYNLAQQQTKRWAEANVARKQLEAADLYQKFLQHKQRTELSLKLATAVQSQQTITTQLSFLESLTEQPLTLPDATAQLAHANRKLGEATSNLQRATQDLNIANNYQTNGKPIYDKVDNLEKFKKCLSDGKFRTTIITKTFADIIQNINANLKEITDFTISYSLDSNNIDLYIIEGKNKMAVAKASGFQRFIISLMFRIAISMNRCSFLIIDEGFGCLDHTNIRHTIDFLSSLTHQYSFLFVISHLSEMQAALTTPLTISRLNGLSHINNRPVEVTVQPTQQSVAIHCPCGQIISSLSQTLHLRTRQHLEWAAQNR